ncbi:excitatory amino acid transporter 2-like [Clavelina lepadiformis]|uniref:excitatory amino acid transporter 2-like n=1 Tax=Clavelina lepadiformis TaxID=159417 RepID=UPI004041B465
MPRSKMESKAEKTTSKSRCHMNRILPCDCRRLRSEELLIILTVAGVLIGVLLGVFLRPTCPSDDVIILITFPGEILMRILKMLIIPTIITSVITGLSGVNLKRGGKMAGHATVYYLTTTTLAVIIGMVLVSIIHPGRSYFDLRSADDVEIAPSLDSFLDLLRNIFPDNIIGACTAMVQTRTRKIASPVNSTSYPVRHNSSFLENVTLVKTLEVVPNTNVLGLLVFSMSFAVTLSSIGRQGKPVKEFFYILNKIFMKMIRVVIWYSPIGIGSLIAGNVLRMETTFGFIETIGWYMGTVLIGLLIHCVIVLPAIFYIITRNNPFRIYKGVFQAWLTALGTASSAATLPVTMMCAERNLNIDKRVTRFVLPLGATMNMDGTALLEAVAAVTIAQMCQIDLNTGQLVTISVTATLASTGAAAIPGAGLMAVLLILSAAGIPSEGIAVLWSVDWILDRLRTSVNILGDCIGAAIVDHLYKSRTKKIQKHTEIVSLKGNSSHLSYSDDIEAVAAEQN